MSAVPREDGGITVHGSLQCPYYIHKAMKRALQMGDELAVVVQAETGGGFGGKEEYPSMIALHAALLARRTGKPVRMIYDRHEDLSATTKTPPPPPRGGAGHAGPDDLRPPRGPVGDDQAPPGGHPPPDGADERRPDRRA